MRKYLRSLAEILRRTPAPTPDEKPRRMFDLSDHEVEMLRQLRNTDEFELYQRVLDQQMNFYAENMLQSRDTNVLHEMRGYTMGVRHAGMLVDEILNKEQEFNHIGRRRQDTGNPRAAATYGSAYWNN
jgi:hypothetical protein